MALAGKLRTQDKHQALIEEIGRRHPGIKTKGFWREVMALADETGSEIRKHPFLPDAFRINRQTRRIEIHEAVNTHDVPARKLHIMGYFWFDWDAECGNDWLPVLYIHKEGQTAPMQMDLCYWYYDLLRTHRDGVQFEDADT